jgi:hypothetical protein
MARSSILATAEFLTKEWLEIQAFLGFKLIIHVHPVPEVKNKWRIPSLLDTSSWCSQSKLYRVLVSSYLKQFKTKT